MNSQEMLQTLEGLLPTFTDTVNPQGFLLNIVGAALCAHILSLLYIRYGKTFSERNQFSRNFVILCLTTTMIITIIKSSLALSLGLVGALSIVRFRTAIKEPEELTYLFVTIGLGIGFGANQGIITLVLFAFIVASMVLRSMMKEPADVRGYGFAFSSGNDSELEADRVMSVFAAHAENYKLKRLERARGSMEVFVWASVKDLGVIDTIQRELAELDGSAKISVFNNEIIFQ